MVAIRDVVLLGAAASGTAATVFIHPLDAIANIEARHDATITVTVTETTCASAGYQGSAPVETPTLPSGSGGYNPPSTESYGSVGTDVTTPATVPTSVVPIPVPSVPTIETTTTEPVPSITTPTIIESVSTDQVTTATSTTASVSVPVTHPTTTPTATPSIPPAVNSAGKMAFGTGALALLAVAAFY